MANGVLTAGTARVVITPPVGIGMAGFAGRPPATGVHDDLTATAIVLAEGDTPEGDTPEGGADGGDTRVALVSLLGEVPAPHATRALQEAHGGVREALRRLADTA